MTGIGRALASVEEKRHPSRVVTHFLPREELLLFASGDGNFLPYAGGGVSAARRPLEYAI